MNAFSEAQVQAVREALPQYLANVHGITDLRRNFRCLNPGHDDGTPSMSYRPDVFRVHCFGACDGEWSIFDLAGWDFGAETFPDRLRAAADAAGVTSASPPPLTGQGRRPPRGKGALSPPSWRARTCSTP
jgi:hypothetical protein